MLPEIGRSFGSETIRHRDNLQHLVTTTIPPSTSTLTSIHAKTVAWIAGAALLRALLSWFVPLLPDETYYWTWTTHLEAGYFDHPPGIALLIAFGTLLGGDTAAGVRAGPAIAAIVTHAAGAVAAWHLAGQGRPGAYAALRAAVLITVLPIATLGMVMATPDAALFAAASLALVAVNLALSSPVRSRASLAWWSVAGVCLGAAFAAKYTAVLLPAALVFACVLHPALRVRFREPGPWLAGVIALGMFSPVVLWNAAHDWISFRFQLGHGFGATARGSVLTRELELVGGQLGLATPILFVLMAVVTWWALTHGWRARRDAQPTDVTARRFAMAVVTVVPLLFFAVSATRRPVEANWPALIYPSAMLLLVTDTTLFPGHLPGVANRWWTRGIALAAVLLAIVSLQAWRPLLPLAPRKDPMARAHGWEHLAEMVHQARRDAFVAGAPHTWLAADRYQDASELWFHLPDQPVVFSLNLGGRPNHYDLWPTAREQIRAGDALVAVFDDNPAGDSLGVRVARWFAASERGEQVILQRGTGNVAHRRIWLYRQALNVPGRFTTSATSDTSATSATPP